MPALPLRAGKHSSSAEGQDCTFHLCSYVRCPWPSVYLTWPLLFPFVYKVIGHESVKSPTGKSPRRPQLDWEPQQIDGCRVAWPEWKHIPKEQHRDFSITYQVIWQQFRAAGHPTWELGAVARWCPRQSLTSGGSLIMSGTCYIILRWPVKEKCLRAWLSVLQLPLPTLSLQSGVSKAREFNLSPIQMSKLALKSAYVGLKVFMEIGKEVGKGGMSGSSTTPYPSSCLVSCYTTVAFLLPAALQWNNLPLFAGFNSGMATFVCSWDTEKIRRKLPLIKLLSSFTVQSS